jgi:hypothetical protein
MVQQFPERRWEVENARGLGRHLAQWLGASVGARTPRSESPVGFHQGYSGDSSHHESLTPADPHRLAESARGQSGRE